MVPNLADGGPLVGIRHEGVLEEVLGVLGHGGLRRKSEIVLFDFPVLLLDVRILKWSLPKQKNVHHYSETPNINTMIMPLPLLRLQHFRSKIIGSSTNRFPPLSLRQQLDS